MMATPTAALAWTLLSGQLFCSQPIPQDQAQQAFTFAKANLDLTTATQVVIVYQTSPQWQTCAKQNPNAFGPVNVAPPPTTKPKGK